VLDGTHSGARYAEAARRAAEFVVAHLYDEGSGTLLRRYRAGEAAIPGFLDDYALFVQGLLDLYEAQFDLRHLELAVRLTEKAAGTVRRRAIGGVLQYRGGRSPAGAAREGRLRWRRAFGAIRWP